jgi:glycosyltransferase involved in cell wall biosynthesis
MKVLVLHTELGHLRGGGENFTRNLFTSFAARGHSVAAIFAVDRRGQYPFPLPDGIEAIPISGWWPMALGDTLLSSIGRHLATEGLLRKKWDRVRESLNGRAYRWYRKRFQQRIENGFAERLGKFDAVYVHGNTLLASQIAKHHRTILRLPGPVGDDMAPLLRSVHAVCANGDALTRIRRFLGDHAKELPLGVETQLFKPGRSSVRLELGWTDRHILIGYVGRLIHLKGVDLLAAAFKRVAQKLPDARFLIIGSGTEENSMRSVLAEEISRGIVFHQPDVSHENLPNWYRAMDLLVMPSRYENLSNALVEGMACGIPFLAADVGGNKTLANFGGGWLFERGSISSLTSELINILNNRTELVTRGALGLQHVRTYHSWDQTAECLENIMHGQLGVRV